MAFLTVSDDTETIEGVLFPRVYREIFNELIDGKLYLGEVKTENREGKIQCIFNKMILIKKS